MILDFEIFKEVIEAIGAETSLAVIRLFMEQSPILVAGAMDNANPTTDRAESLHALKGMAEQLGLKQLSQNCVTAETAILDAQSGEAVALLVKNVEASLFIAQKAVMESASQLIPGHSLT